MRVNLRLVNGHVIRDMFYNIVMILNGLIQTKACYTGNLVNKNLKYDRKTV